MTPYYADDSVTLLHGDCLDVMRQMPDASVDAIVTDPPYGLGFMGKEWDDLPPGLPWAQGCLRVLKPGGHLLAFGGTRTWHRLAVAVEDAGFEVRDSIAWLYGSGFPKSLDVSKAIDKRPGVGRHPEFAADLRAAMDAKGYTNTFDVAEAVIGRRTGAVANWQKYQWPEAKWWPALRDLLDMDEAKWGPVIAEAERAKTGTKRTGDPVSWYAEKARGDGVVDITAPATPAAQQWQGWGTALKPAFEPIVVARKPFIGTVAANVLEWGTGALNIDGTRVTPTGESRPRVNEPSQERRYTAEGGTNFAATPGVRGGAPEGRWPANVLLDGDAAAGLDASTDNASRFFPTFKYQAKAPTRERPSYVKDDGTKVAHPTVKSLELMKFLVRLVTPPGGTVLDPFAGSGTTIEAAMLEGFRVIGIEREADYLPLIETRIDRARPTLTQADAVADALALFDFEEPA